MRITNKMMTNNMMTNINRNKLNMTDLEQQYSTGKKIQKPSDDPIIAVRALKLRTNLSVKRAGDGPGLQILDQEAGTRVYTKTMNPPVVL